INATRSAGLDAKSCKATVLRAAVSSSRNDGAAVPRASIRDCMAMSAPPSLGPQYIGAVYHQLTRRSRLTSGGSVPGRADGSAGDADYGVIARTYSKYRQPDPRIAAAIHGALGDSAAVLNVGAGAGSYEPADRKVVAVEPSASMRAQRPAHLLPAVDALAENLPFPDARFDACMAIFTVHQWSDVQRGLREMRRV